MNSHRALKTLVVLFALIGTIAHADSGKRTGTSGASELTIPVGARGIGMAGATVAMTRGVDALFWNPAGASYTQFGVGILASHMQYIADIGVSAAAVSVKFESFGVLSLHIKGLSMDPIPITTVQQPDGTGATFTPLFVTAGLTYSRHLTDRVAIGATAMLVREQMSDVAATGVAFTLGIMYDNLASIEGLSIGVAVKNLGPSMKFSGSGLNVQAQSADLTRGPYVYDLKAASFELPTSFELGLAYLLPVLDDHGLVFATSYQNNNFSDDDYKIGVEYGYQDLLFVRGGFTYTPAQISERENLFGPSFGLGVHTLVGGADVTFDYAFRWAKFFDNNHVFAVKFGL